MQTPKLLLAAAVPIAIAGLALAGCSATGTSSATPSAGGAISVVTVTDVWGDVAKQIGGDRIDVTAFIQGTARDPHSYEATAQDQLAIKNAGLVIENGGGYDDFMDTLVSASGTGAPVLNAVQLSGLPGAGGDDFNEHVFYDFPTVDHVASAIAAQLTALDAADASTFAANLSTFEGKLTALESREADLAKLANGAKVVITEPVPLYVLAASGFTNVTPPAFSEAVEEGTDISPSLLNQVIGIVQAGDVKLFAYNSQTSGPETQAVLTAAQAAGVDSAGFTETLPDGQDYLAWMSANLDAVQSALQ